MENHIQLQGGGIKCDHCDYRDDNVAMEDYANWVNKPCPKCGENLLTKEDYESVLQIQKIAEFVNTLSPEELEAVKQQFKQPLPEGINENDKAVARFEFDGSGRTKMTIRKQDGESDGEEH